MPIVDELIEVAVKHGAGKKQDYASDMTIADVFRRFAEKMSEGSGGGDVQDYEVTPIKEMGKQSTMIYLYFDGLWLSEMEPNLRKGARIHVASTEDFPIELYLYMAAKVSNTIYMACFVPKNGEPGIILFDSHERVEGAYFQTSIS